ncbi:hypothetical protein CTEN210_11654 [Chaetoceros tenuissimus]|uniref:MYND-type domain-containing protein n=1 Tax=Chaetoceros tenuissimus TaxID=426638 RepID=A0AAD3CZQ0_9STRA|nr:hypothetical protein CTEN210_11654 [Chaetoceros tenuissimus]
MAKKKTSRANRKKNRKAAAGEKASLDSTSERVNSKQDVSGYADFQPFQIDGSLPAHFQTFLQNANHHIQNQSLGTKEQERLLKKMDAIYDKDLRKWVQNLLTVQGTGELYSLGPCMSVVFAKLVFLIKNAISTTKKRDVLINGLHLHVAFNVMLGLMHVMNTNEEEVLDLLKSLTNTAKAVSGTHYSSSGAAYALCHSMINCYFYIRDKKGDDAKPLMMIAKSGILEQVLLHIHLSWSPQVDEQALLDGYHGSLYKFFGILNSYASVIHKIFKEGTACHNALNVIVQDRILYPCKENEHMIEHLQSLKKISDLSNNRSVDTQLDMDVSTVMDEKVIDMARHTCAKCNTVDLERPLLVCAKCKGAGYCSKECQVTDWKKHKEDCHRKFSDWAKSTCTHCCKVNLDKELLVCAKCKYAGYCSKECQVSDWKNHKKICDLLRKTKYKNIDEIMKNFLREHQELIAEKVKAASVKTGLESIDLAVDLDFKGVPGEVAPALRSPPEFEVLPTNIFWNREEDKAPANHWFFEDLGGGRTYYSDDDVKRVRQGVSTKYKMLGLDMSALNVVFIFLHFGETPSISAVPSSLGSM